jgi:hypothetical protein
VCCSPARTPKRLTRIRRACRKESNAMCRHWILAFGAALLALAVTSADADDRRPAVHSDFGADRFSAGALVRIDRPVDGDLFAVGGSIDADGAVGGDAVLAGGNVRIGAPVAQSVYAAGGQLVINAPIGRNVRIAGGQVEIGRRGEIAGNLSVAGGEVRIDGRVKGYLRGGGGSVRIDGPVDSDVEVRAGEVELGPNARIAGRLRYASRDEIRSDPAAQVQGGIERLTFAVKPARPDLAARASHAPVGRAWSLGLMLIAAVLSAALPQFYPNVVATMRTRPGLSVLIGFIALVCIPAAALLLLLTVIGVPLALLVVALYFALLLIGYVSAGIGLGDWALQRHGGERAKRTAWRLLAAAGGMLVITLLARLPWVGTPVAVAAMLLGLGALVLQVPRHRSAAT